MQDSNKLQSQDQRLIDLENRLARLEGATAGDNPSPFKLHPAWVFALGLAALACGYLGTGLPRHYYPPLFALLTLALAYHRGVWLPARGAWCWPQVVLNGLLLCLMFALLINAGTAQPLGWLRIPALALQPPAEDASWLGRTVPDLVLAWKGIPGVSDWQVDLARLQALLLVVTLLGAAFRFQPFASFTALALLLVSVPTLTRFDWDWLILFLVLGGSALYLQAPAVRR